MCRVPGYGEGRDRDWREGREGRVTQARATAEKTLVRAEKALVPAERALVLVEKAQALGVVPADPVHQLPRPRPLTHPRSETLPIRSLPLAIPLSARRSSST